MRNRQVYLGIADLIRDPLWEMCNQQVYMVSADCKSSNQYASE